MCRGRMLSGNIVVAHKVAERYPECPGGRGASVAGAALSVPAAIDRAQSGRRAGANNCNIDSKWARMDTVVETRCGKLRGRLSDGLGAFKGVPYAATPFGLNRLLPPCPVEPWNGMRDALAFGPKSPQVSYPPGIAEALAELVGAGEDCLTLNIWAPDFRVAGLPVMVWIPGGMFEFHATRDEPTPRSGARSRSQISHGRRPSMASRRSLRSSAFAGALQPI